MKESWRKDWESISSNRIFLLSLAALCVAALSISPILSSGYTSDDGLNSLMKGYLIDQHKSLFQFNYEIINGWLGVGRFYPMAYIVTYSFFNFVLSLKIYKLMVLLLIVADLIVFGFLIRLLTGSSSAGAMGLILAPLFFQLRLYHDPIMGFCFLLELTFLYIALSLISLVIYMKSHKVVYLILSLILYLVGLLTYDIAVFFSILHFLIIRQYSEKKGWASPIVASLPFFVLSLLNVLLVVFLRLHFNTPLIGGTTQAGPYTINPSLGTVTITLSRQLFASFPLSYYFMDVSNLFYHDLPNLVNHLSIAGLVIGLIYFLVYILISREVLKEMADSKVKLNSSFLLVFGMAMMIVPSILISLAKRYQGELTWGLGYLPVYVSYFGLMIIAMVVIYKIYEKASRLGNRYAIASLVILGVMFTLASAVNYSNNLEVVDSSNSFFLYPRQVVEKCIEDGTFNLIPDNSILLIDNNHLWDQPAFYSINCPGKWRYVGSSNPLPYALGYIFEGLPRSALAGNDGHVRYLYNFSEGDQVYYLRYFSVFKDEGYAVLGKTAHMSATQTLIEGATAKEAYIYVRVSNSPYETSQISAVGYQIGNLHSSSEPFILGEDKMKLISAGKDWKLLQMVADNGTSLDLKSLHVDIKAEKVETSVFT